MKPKPPYGDTEAFDIVTWPMLEEMSSHGCGCGSDCGCGDKFTADNPPELAVKCHTGSPLWVAYWDGWLYLSCGHCAKPVGRIRVEEAI